MSPELLDPDQFDLKDSRLRVGDGDTRSAQRTSSIHTVERLYCYTEGHRGWAAERVRGDMVHG